MYYTSDKSWQADGEYFRPEKEPTFMSEAEQERQPSQNITFPVDTDRLPTSRIIDGPLPKGKWLAHPVVVQIENDDGEVVVSEPHFYMHAAAPTVPEAIAAFKRILVDELEVLSSEEAELGPRLLAQLRYLRNTIKAA